MVLRYDDRRDENKTLRMGVNYSLESMSVKRVEAEISYKLTDTLKLATAVSYDGEKNQWNRGDVALIADLHCRESWPSLRHRPGPGVARIQFAFPSEPVKLGLGDEEGVLLESICSLWSNERTEAAVYEFLIRSWYSSDIVHTRCNCSCVRLEDRRRRDR